jgi:hypothetical protein
MISFNLELILDPNLESICNYSIQLYFVAGLQCLAVSGNPLSRRAEVGWGGGGVRVDAIF